MRANDCFSKLGSYDKGVLEGCKRRDAVRVGCKFTTPPVLKITKKCPLINTPYPVQVLH